MTKPRTKISRRKLKSGKTSYVLRWVCPSELKWKARTVGHDYKRAQGELAKLEQEIADGSYKPEIGTDWEVFVREVAGYRTGSHAAGVRSTLREFGDRFSVSTPRQVTPKMVRAYVLSLEARGCKAATTNAYLRNLRLAFRQAVDDNYMRECPVKRVHFRPVLVKDDGERRILSPEEEPKLLDATERLYGFPMRTFTEFALETWARLGEATKLAWDDVCFDDPGVLFRSTKSHENRLVPIEDQSLMGKLRRLQAMTLQAGGPFRCFADRSNLRKKWKRIVADAGIEPITVHDLRRTGISRALLDGMPLAAVKKLAGHRSITTTERYYLGVGKQALRDAVKRRKAASAG